jgi:phytanoyl-CoA hydroxylase
MPRGAPQRAPQRTIPSHKNCTNEPTDPHLRFKNAGSPTNEPTDKPTDQPRNDWRPSFPSERFGSIASSRKIASESEALQEFVMTTSTAPSAVTIKDLEFFADRLDPRTAAAAYKEHGAIIVRGLMSPYVNHIRQDIEACATEAIALLPQAVKVPEGWLTPDHTLWLPAPANFSRDKQIMVLGCNYKNSAASFMSAIAPKLLDIVEAIVGPDVELFMDGQCLYKEPVGGHAKNLHQDAAYFEHRFEGPVGVLNYCVDTDLSNGALHVIPGTHRLGVLDHVDTSSHLGLDEKTWPWERALPLTGKAGDAIFFHVKTVHGSKSNSSNSSRPVMIHRYRRADDYVVISATGVEKRKAASAHVEQAKKDNQKGFLVRGRRKHDTGRETATL